MPILILYETRFGATRTIAEEIAAGARRVTTVDVVAIEDLAPRSVRHAELILPGAPTRSRTLSYARHPGADGVTAAADGRRREWLERSSRPDAARSRCIIPRRVPRGTGRRASPAPGTSRAPRRPS
ncbi:flavodoxin domain-containing protein [Clavibacter michiganensis]|uniref:flavodoxin domain-containing protein n=1 Tax=Clavibacter michiganensis TaxID=28447 RepID=UPI00142F6E93|nr:flavodoxin domain-containing protein [Clavibacter michiganensis]QIT10162.1 hypothetical protein GRD74_01055 [Clavibacter michiganensis subsp. michiganensis]